MTATPFIQLGVALALGLLVGMQRERTEHSVAGVRTFPLITMLGTVCAQLAPIAGGWVIAAGLLALAAFFVSASFVRVKAGEIDPGITTEVAALLLFVVGALTVTHLSAAVIVGGLVVLLLHLKAEMHGFVAAIGERELRAIMQFVLVSLIILPVLPNQSMGPYQVLNPFKIWMMVVLIVGISLAGYVALKLLGARAGTVVGGVLGGLVSSTATTVSFARTSRSGKETGLLCATVIMIASAIVYVRVLALVAAASAPALRSLAPPLLALLAVMIVLAGAAFWFSRRQTLKAPEPDNPAELKSALIFGVLYALVLLLVAAARERFGQTGIYTVALLAGLADMDAITLSTSQLVANGSLEPGTGWRAILAASLSNIVFKAGVVAFLGSRALLLHLGLLFAIALAAGGAILWIWP
jgi:uncharacterized membrane protein (DUF4010 family)